MIVALIGAVATMLLATPAGAFHTKNPSRNDQWDAAFAEGDVYQGFDPMETSVPYVAWRGEEVRLVKCFDREYFEPRRHGDPDEGGVLLLASEADETGEWAVMDWSGDAHVWPQFFDDNDRQTRVFWASEGDQYRRGCFAIDITSHKPGIAVVKLKIDDEGLREGGAGSGVPGEGDPVAVHQFNVIWMEFDSARLRCLESTGASTPVSGCPGAGPVITENISDKNRLGVVVQGRVPLNEQFRTELGAQNAAFADGRLVFPEDYPALASTSLAHVSWALQKANNGIEGDDNFNNATCDDSPDDGDLDDPDPDACVLDVGDDDYVPEPNYRGRGGTFAAGNFWDIHDSTGPYNTTVYRTPGTTDKPLINEIEGCGVPPTGVPVGHNPLCHVDQLVDADTLDAGGGGDPTCDDGDPDGGGGPRDTVDNCDEGEFDSFSRVFHDVSGEDGELATETDEATIGPYSPTRPDETMLSDSEVNAHDAPMPAALVIASIADNDPDTIGHLESVDKHVVYNRRGTACDDRDNEHCVTGPFSGAYIPPSPTMENDPAEDVEPGSGDFDDPDVASGIHGSIANNFNGYLPVFYPERPLNRGMYHYWDIVETGDVSVDVPNGCADFRTPAGVQELWLYTDEHGEAQFLFDTGRGFNFDPDAGPNDGVPFLNSQDGCVPTGTLGTAEITVNARYPFQPLTAAGVTSNQITKRVLSRFRKGIVCVPKRDEESTKAICVVFARSIFGTPLNETVCISVTGSNNVSVRDYIPDYVSQVPGTLGLLCVDTDDTGINLPEDLKDDILTAAPFLDSTFGTDAVLIIGQGSHLVTADFIEERIEVQVNITIPSSTGTVGGTSVVPGPQPTGAVVLPGGAVINQVATGTRSTGATSSSGNGKPSISSTAARKKASLVFVRIAKQLKLGLNNRFVVLRVKSSLKNEVVQIKLIGKRGKVLGTVLRKVKTNRTIRVPNLRLPKAAVTVRAKVVFTA